MKLKDYLAKEKIKMIDFAAIMGVGYNAICTWCRGAVKPSDAMKTKIQIQTNKKVKIADWENS